MNPVIFALDVPRYNAAAAKLVAAVSPHIGVIKIGLELFIAEGPQVLKQFQLPIFLDLKLHDIPDTVERALIAAAKHGVKFVTIHVQQAKTMLRASCIAEEYGITILGVTVLTSMDAFDLLERKVQLPKPGEYARYLASHAYELGTRGFVCSGQEVASIRDVAPEAVLVTPGVRSPGVDSGSQKRIVTPKEALDNGADYIVVGRQFRDATDPALEAQRLLKEIG
jgi:orotidine-5'-phosphate decarboxylase